MNRVKDIVDAIDEGRVNSFFMRKTLTQPTSNFFPCDLSFGAGKPSPNFYTGNEMQATLFEQSKSIYKGDGKYLFSVTTQAGSLMAMTLCDMIMYYPQIDMDNTDIQIFENSVSLPRFTDGKGLQMFLVAQYPYVGNANCTISYQDQADTEKSVTFFINTAGFIGTILHDTMFIRLSSLGVQKLNSIRFAAPCGGVGALVICKPVYNTLVRESNSPNEANCFTDSALLPAIHPNACLNFLALPNNNIQNVPISAHLKFIS